MAVIEQLRNFLTGKSEEFPPDDIKKLYVESPDFKRAFDDDPVIQSAQDELRATAELLLVNGTEENFDRIRAYFKKVGRRCPEHVCKEMGRICMEKGPCPFKR